MSNAGVIPVLERAPHRPQGRVGEQSVANAIASQAQPVVSVRDLHKQFRREDGRTVPAIDGISLDVGQGEVLVLLGPSGCGKTTLLRAIAGLEKPDAGQIVIHGQPAFDGARGLNRQPEDRRISMIFQSYALWPHMSAADNVSYPLVSRGMAKATAAAQAVDALRQVGIGDLGGQYPAQMSGGQQQRVALARAVVSKDALVLFDEPLSNVDAKVRQQLRLELIDMQRKLGFSAVYVTHDQIEAMALADRIAVLRQGRVEQIGAPDAIYDRPVSRYVANFIGTTNELPGRVIGVAAGQAEVDTALGRLSVGAPDGAAAGDAVCVLFRPEHCAVGAARPADGPGWEGVVVNSVFLGAYTETLLRCGHLQFQVWGQSAPLPAGATMWVSTRAERLRMVPQDS
ncbi:ABC transporter ATP-binding protein [Chelatococcus asaccharovorans]|uniref:Iron(III) transport system ATP-binding protein n=1 Tax=Chelatococcus asaccharovorans TaxID=28210 RepID=A0A2V3UJY5_9HYPH|nr:ABC transporter ATP-binding protein [Chelatococcus asaccharovorans]MBS7706220.1 ABC transporter ATP-binding protein [Chelatococcus asaccharovorans]PXW65147.1 iron(III) transport system ATP-binding protein [Chelatococcus asaccharovorans]CAH1660419.1 Spermidine/putrescine import ATP-binding protein PotA 2 [Chelatococcus asaccharovorans]CAH1683811.1 Spermidine/putrescine import ATP-binding protein PotA 2 [Chelatococcus asaccharovorans]